MPLDISANDPPGVGLWLGGLLHTAWLAAPQAHLLTTQDAAVRMGACPPHTGTKNFLAHFPWIKHTEVRVRARHGGME